MGRNHIDITNKKYGLLTTIEKIKERGTVYYKCICECGNMKTIRSHDLISGAVQSCGCLRSVKRRKEMLGRQFGMWLVLSYSHGTGGKTSRRHFYLCECQCENKTIKIIDGAALRNGTSKSCGCYQKEIVSRIMFKHGDYKHPFYFCWQSIKRRCNNPSETSYHNYGGRGISYDVKWENYLGFKEDMYGEYLKCLERFPNKIPTIERKDHEGDYYKDNCTFIPLEMQPLNTRKIKFFKAISPYGIEYYSKNQNEFARQNNLSPSGINNCLRRRQSNCKNWIFKYITEEEFEQNKLF